MKGKIDIISALYALTYKRRGVPMRLLNTFMKVLEKSGTKDLDRYRMDYVSEFQEPERRIDNLIVSLTSFPQRIDDVWKTIISLKRQTFRPEKIILWLSLVEFPSRLLPASLTEMQDSQFEIRFREGDFKSHTKYYYAFKEFQNSKIITVDDDVYYHKDTVKHLIKEHEKHTNAIISNRVRQMIFKEKTLLPYNYWKTMVKGGSHKDLFFLGVDGVLYPENIMPEMVLNPHEFMSLTPKADDVWLNAMAQLKNIPIIKTDFRFRNLPTYKGEISLQSINCEKNLNDKQINNIRKFLKKKIDKDIFIAK